MTTSTTAREFVRNFSRLRKVAANGGEVIVRDRSGQAFVFRATTEGSRTLADQLGDLQGVFSTGVKAKSLRGFGHNRK